MIQDSSYSDELRGLMFGTLVAIGVAGTVKEPTAKDIL